VVRRPAPPTGPRPSVRCRPPTRCDGPRQPEASVPHSRPIRVRAADAPQRGPGARAATPLWRASGGQGRLDRRDRMLQRVGRPRRDLVRADRTAQAVTGRHGCDTPTRTRRPRAPADAPDLAVMLSAVSAPAAAKLLARVTPLVEQVSPRRWALRVSALLDPQSAIFRKLARRAPGTCRLSNTAPAAPISTGRVRKVSTETADKNQQYAGQGPPSSPCSSPRRTPSSSACGPTSPSCAGPSRRRVRRGSGPRTLRVIAGLRRGCAQSRGRAR